MQFAIWGVGKRLKRYLDCLNLEQVACFIDSNSKNISEAFYGKRVIFPAEIPKWNIDYFVVSSDQFFQEIAAQLVTEFGIDVKNIINFQTFLYITGIESEELWNPNLIDIFYDISAAFQLPHFLDVGMYFNHIGYWHENEMDVDGCGCGENLLPRIKKPYGHIWKTVEAVEMHYDMAVIFQPEKWDVSSLCRQIAGVSDNVFVRISEELFQDGAWMQQLRLVNFRGYLFGIFMAEKENGTIFEVSHKRFAALGDPLYQPLYVGNAEKSDKDVLHDNSGDNIAQYNPLINECTALYWIWKNTNCWSVGFNHYRRFFQSPINPYSPIQRWELNQFLRKYDICVASPVGLRKEVKVMLNEDIDNEAFQAVFPEIQKIFQTMGGRDYEAFSYVMDCHMIYPCNMFLTTRTLLNQYCEWLFPILLQLLENVEIKEEWDCYSRRVAGFFAERLLTVWLIQQDYKIKELSVLFVNEKETI